MCLSAKLTSSLLFTHCLYEWIILVFNPHSWGLKLMAHCCDLSKVLVWEDLSGPNIWTPDTVNRCLVLMVFLKGSMNTIFSLNESVSKCWWYLLFISHLSSFFFLSLLLFLCCSHKLAPTQGTNLLDKHIFLTKATSHTHLLVWLLGAVLSLTPAGDSVERLIISPDRGCSISQTRRSD